VKNIKNEGVRRLATQRAAKRPATEASTRDQGFGTMDVLIAVLILGIMSAISVTALGTMLTTAHKGSCASDGSTLATAISEWDAQTSNTLLSSIGSTPSSPYLAPLTSAQTLTVNGTSVTVGPYLQNLPSTGNGYTFSVSSTSNALQIAIGTGSPVAWTGPSQCSLVS